MAKLPDRQRQQAISKGLGESLSIASSSWLLLGLDVADRTAMQSQLIGLAFALAAYRLENGSYPEKLASLSPKYLAAVPNDFFDHGADLHYRREGAGYLLYSIGTNGKDDGGKTREERFKSRAPASVDWDDIVVRMPAKS